MPQLRSAAGLFTPPQTLYLTINGVSRGLTNSPQGRFVPALRAVGLFDPSSRRINHRPPWRETPWGPVIYAGDGGRTHTPSRATDFESVSSANSNTPASYFFAPCGMRSL